MNNKKKKKIEKYTALYMSLGMCFGVSGGLIYGSILFPDNMSMGISISILIGIFLNIKYINAFFHQMCGITMAQCMFPQIGHKNHSTSVITLLLTTCGRVAITCSH